MIYPEQYIQVCQSLLYGKKDIEIEKLYQTPEEELRKNSPQYDDRRFKESMFRAIMSRLYYAAFYVVSNKLGIKISIREFKETIHSAVVRLLKQRNKFLGETLDDLRELRIYADYDVKETFGKIDWNLCHNMMIDTMELLRSLEGIVFLITRPYKNIIKKGITVMKPYNSCSNPKGLNCRDNNFL